MLLRTGMGVRQALCYNILSSALCLAGTAIGLSLGGVSSATGWVFAVTAGIFLYVALVDMVSDNSSYSVRAIYVRNLRIHRESSIDLLLSMEMGCVSYLKPRNSMIVPQILSHFMVRHSHYNSL